MVYSLSYDVLEQPNTLNYCFTNIEQCSLEGVFIWWCVVVALWLLLFGCFLWVIYFIVFVICLQTKRTKKAGIVGKYGKLPMSFVHHFAVPYSLECIQILSFCWYCSYIGTRYGASLRKQIKKMEVSQHSKYFCEFCGKVIQITVGWLFTLLVNFLNWLVVVSATMLSISVRLHSCSSQALFCRHVQLLCWI
jgi:ribosomal protein L37AE/L43A